MVISMKVRARPGRRLVSKLVPALLAAALGPVPTPAGDDTSPIRTGGSGSVVAGWTASSDQPPSAALPPTPSLPGAWPATPPWTWPLEPRPVVIHAYVAPATPYGPGHRGIDLSAGVGAAVHAVAAGRVTHVGVVAGRATVSVTHASGVRSTYEPVSSDLHVGDPVDRGQVVGQVTDGPGHCLPRTCLHLGARRGGRYLDPLTLLVPSRVILLPARR